MKTLVVLALLICASAQGATGLAIVTKDTSCAGKAVKGSTCVQTYNTPVAGDVVRTRAATATGDPWADPSFAWKAWSDLKDGEIYEGCGNDVAEGLSIDAPGCNSWPWFTKHTSLVTIDTTVWRHTDALNKVTLYVAGSIALGVKCDATQALGGLYVVPQTSVKFTTSTKYVISLAKCAVPAPIVTPPVTPPVIPPVQPPPTTTGAKKWNPGHYIRSQEGSFASQQSARRGYYDLIKSDQAFKGGLLMVPWGQVETAKGVYDFSQIDADLAYVKSLGKKLIIEIWWMNFWSGTNLPSAPQSGDKWVPDYIVAAGGIRSMQYGGYIAKIDEAQWMDRLIALNDALAARYDSNPDVEQLVMTETANAWTNTGQFDRLIPAMGTAWKQTVAVMYMNWVTSAADALRLSTLAAQYGVGLGGPDLLPGNEQAHAALSLQGIAGYSTRDLRGAIPSSWSYEAVGNTTPANTIDYAIGVLKATHIAWSAASWLTPEQNFTTGVLPVVRAHPTLTSACPTVFKSCVQ